MKGKLARALTVVAIVAAGSAVAAVPASASERGPGLGVCITNQPTWLRDMPWGIPLRTLSPGRGFRVHWAIGGDNMQPWFYGHGAEAPEQDGWIPAANCG